MRVVLWGRRAVETKMAEKNSPTREEHKHFRRWPKLPKTLSSMLEPNAMRGGALPKSKLRHREAKQKPAPITKCWCEELSRMTCPISPHNIRYDKILYKKLKSRRKHSKAEAT